MISLALYNRLIGFSLKLFGRITTALDVGTIQTTRLRGLNEETKSGRSNKKEMPLMSEMPNCLLVNLNFSQVLDMKLGNKRFF